MDYVRLGGSDLEVSRLCLGTWNMGGSRGWGPEDDARSIELIRRAQDSGCNFFDSAHGYGRGHAEEILGRALEEDNRRERAVVGTKIMQCAPRRVEPSLDAALKRLRSDYVDLYIVHWPRPSQSLEAFLATMVEMREKGKARQIGVSNFNLEQMKLADRYGVVSLQPPYNVLWRIIEPEVLPFCRERDIGVTPYSSLAQGLLTGRFTRSEEPPTGIRTRNVLFEEPVFTKAREAAGVVDEIADDHGRTSSQVALAWLLHTEGVTAPIVGISKWEQWMDNLGALDVQLSDEEYDRISRAGMAVWDMLPEDATMWGWKPD
ncbi:MAG: aldo/keto reductase [Candidatus Brocadiaceae bacterium]|jgi:aryl-alcohol dehydrogenase-like predicted oxidoreductase